MLWLLGCLARPYRPWKVVVVVSMAALAALAYVLPAGRSFFAIAWQPAALGWGLLAGAIGAVVVEIAFRVSRGRVTTVEAGHREPQSRGTSIEDGQTPGHEAVHRGPPWSSRA